MPGTICDELVTQSTFYTTEVQLKCLMTTVSSLNTINPFLYH